MSTTRDAIDVSVIISTHNRGDHLRDTLDSLLSQRLTAVAFEAVVVDNNSTDHTKAVIEEYAVRSGGRIRYLFEPRQGVSFGRNAGILAARASIIAFTDDDVVLAADWVVNIARAFDAHPQVDYVTGRILPLFEAPPPAWLTSGNSGVCAIRDRGDVPLYGTRGHFFAGWATVNMAMRRAMLERSGLFATDFPRGEDLELIIRVWRAGGQGMYAPDVVVNHKIPRERLTKTYHRMWHMREGDIRAKVRYKELCDHDGRLLDRSERAALWGVPLFLARQLVHSGVRWLLALIRRRDADAFSHECQLRQTFSYLRTRVRQRHAAVPRAVVAWTQPGSASIAEGSAEGEMHLV